MLHNIKYNTIKFWSSILHIFLDINIKQIYMKNILWLYEEIFVMWIV
jgi:hypothetical protein